MSDQKSPAKRNLTHERLHKFLQDRKKSEMERAGRHALPNAVDPLTGEPISRVELVRRRFDAQIAAIPGAPEPKAAKAPEPKEEPVALAEDAPPALDPDAELGLRKSGKGKSSK